MRISDWSSDVCSSDLVQRSGDARALQRLGRAIFLAQRHQARHFGFGDRDFLASEIGKTDVGDHIVTGVGGESGHGRFLLSSGADAWVRPQKGRAIMLRALAESAPPIKYKDRKSTRLNSSH